MTCVSVDCLIKTEVEKYYIYKSMICIWYDIYFLTLFYYENASICPSYKLSDNLSDNLSNIIAVIFCRILLLHNRYAVLEYLEYLESI